MSQIPKTFGDGGASGDSTVRSPSLKEIFFDVADDLAAGRAALITSPDGVAAAGAAPDKAEFDAVVLLVNELKAALNTVSTTTLKTTKEA